MFHRSTLLLPVEVDHELNEQIDKSIDRILVLAIRYKWNPTVHLASVHRSIKAWHLHYWDGGTEWVKHVRIDRDLQGLACALRKAIPRVHAPSRGVYATLRDQNALHYFGKSGMKELSAAVERNLVQKTIHGDDVVTTRGVIIDLSAVLYGHRGTIDVHGSPDQDARSPGTPLSGEALESRCLLGGELRPNG
jgi:hypothetical protein